ncbi:solute carrier family 25 member 45-like [Pseudophryne corroboree]|uniref:solute carrier family 25 member 45-like n=1 Tax=Pseudophryne corroboree TaxID=495146 RepID=UPI003082184D
MMFPPPCFTVGALGLVVGHPIDTIKVRLQTQSRYHGIIDCIVKTYKKESVSILCSPIKDTWTMLFAGGCAGTVGWAAANPMDVLKSRLQMDGMYSVQYQGIFDCIYKSIKQEGAKVLLKGLTVNSLRAFPVNAVTFLSYEKLLQILR